MSYLTGDLGVSSNRVSSIKSAVSSLSNYIELILDEEYPLFKNIIKNIPTPVKQFVRTVEIPTEEELFSTMDKLVELKKYQVACFLAVLFASGCRKAEAIQMKVDDFSPDKVVLEGMFYQTSEKRTKGRGKEGKILKKNVIKDIVDKYLILWLEEREKLGIKNEYLFVTIDNGNYVQAKIATANSWGEKIRKIAGKEFPIHQIRHSWTDHLLRAGYPETVVQKLQGWSDVGMVSYYSQIDDTEKLEDFFKSLSKKEENKI